MSPIITSLYFLAFLFLTMVTISTESDLEMVQMAKNMILHAKNWARTSSSNEASLLYNHGQSHGSGHHGDAMKGFSNDNNNSNNYYQSMAMVDCAKLYDQAQLQLTRLLKHGRNYSHDDAITWLSGVTTSHRTCLDGLKERGATAEVHPFSQNLTMVLNEVLAFHVNKHKNVSHFRAKDGEVAQRRPMSSSYFREQFTSWNPATSRSDIVVARDGTGDYRTINEAMDTLGRIIAKSGIRRVVVYVKAGVYDEVVEIPRNLKNVMFVGDGMDKTVVTGSRNVIDGASTFGSATFGVYGDRFWARDITFENTAGPQKHQAVALMVASDQSLFYRCSFRGYQDTLYVHSLRQFYRDCHIYGTIDFIFGNAAVVLQNCDIFVRKPMHHQNNMITAQGRASPNENTGISIHRSRIRPAPDFVDTTWSVKTFLGRPWKKYSRTIVAKTNIGGLIHPSGWTKWNGNFALSTLYYAEYMNAGEGSSTQARVKWPGFHVLHDRREVDPFLVRNFIQGQSWIMKTDVPIWLEM